MFKAQISRVWRGSYSYDLQETLDQTEKTVTFQMHLTLKWFGKFEGEIAEDESGIPEWAKVSGRVTGKQIQFSKQYPSLWVSDETGESISLPDQSSAKIFYLGTLSDDGRHIEGQWNIPAETRVIYGQEYDFPGTSGTWQAEAADGENR